MISVTTLLLLTFLVFLVFWIGDAVLTRRTVSEMDESTEVNPLMRKVLGFRKEYLWIFKSIEVSAFGYLIFYLSNFDSSLSFNILLAYIVFYGILVWNNNRVYFKATGEPSTTFRTVFLLMILITTSFIFLNNALYQDVQAAYDEFSECSSDYTELQNRCQSNTSELNQSYDGELEDRLDGLDLTGDTG